MGEGVSMALQLGWQCFVCLLPFHKKEHRLSVPSTGESMLSAYDTLKLKADREASEVLYWLEDTPLFETAEKVQLAKRCLI